VYDHIKNTDESWKEAPRSFLDLGGLDKDVTAMLNSLKRGLGAGCIYSLLEIEISNNPHIDRIILSIDRSQYSVVICMASTYLL
jgi:hypothetical protein